MYLIFTADDRRVGKRHDTKESAFAAARKLANRYHKKYYVMWNEPGQGTTTAVILPD